MPSFIVVRVGAWDNSVALNRRSADAAKHDNARQHYAKLVELTREVDTAAPEFTRAKTHLASR